MSIQSSGNAQFKAVLSTSSHYQPSFKDIWLHGKEMTRGADNRHSIDFFDLKPGGTYDVFVSGREEFGTVIQPQRIQFETLRVKEQLVCPVGWVLTEDSNGSQVDCSGNGVCSEGVCQCHDGYRESACQLVKEEVLEAATPSTVLLHLTATLKGSFSNSLDLTQYAQTSLHKGWTPPLPSLLVIASVLSVAVTRVHIRQWVFLREGVSSLSRRKENESTGEVHVMLTVAVARSEGEKMHCSLSEALREGVVRSELAKRGVNVQSLEVALPATDHL